MTSYGTYGQQLLVGLVRTAPVDVLGEVMERLLPEKEGREKALVALAARRDAERLLLDLLPKLSAEEELRVAQVPGLGEDVLDRLARSRRKRTVALLADRDDLPDEVMVTLSRSKHPEVAWSVRQSGRLPVDEIRRLWADGERGHLHVWCTQDPQLLTATLQERLELLRAEPHQEGIRVRRGPHLEVLPDGEVPTEALPVLRELLGELVRRGMYGDLLAYARTRPRGEALVALMETIGSVEPRTPEVEALVTDVSKYLGAPVFGSGVRVRGGGTISRWGDDDPRSVLAAHRAGGAARHLALAHPGCPEELRRAAVESSEQTEYLSAALNPNLTPTEVETLLEKVEPRHRWRLAGAGLQPAQVRQVLDGGPGILTLARMADGADRETLQERWLGEEACRYVLENRETCLGSDTKGTTRMLAHVLKKHPGLAGTVLAVLRPSDTLPDGAQDLLAQHLLGRGMGIQEVVTFCSLLEEWEGKVDDLLDTVEVLGQ